MYNCDTHPALYRVGGVYKSALQMKMCNNNKNMNQEIPKYVLVISSSSLIAFQQVCVVINYDVTVHR